MPAHWHSRFSRHSPSLQTLCWLWSRDASRGLSKKTLGEAPDAGADREDWGGGVGQAAGQEAGIIR